MTWLPQQTYRQWFPKNSEKSFQLFWIMFGANVLEQWFMGKLSAHLAGEDCKQRRSFRVWGSAFGFQIRRPVLQLPQQIHWLVKTAREEEQVQRMGRHIHAGQWPWSEPIGSTFEEGGGRGKKSNVIFILESFEVCPFRVSKECWGVDWVVIELVHLACAVGTGRCCYGRLKMTSK